MKNPVFSSDIKPPDLPTRIWETLISAKSSFVFVTHYKRLHTGVTMKIPIHWEPVCQPTVWAAGFCSQQGQDTVLYSTASNWI